MSILKTLSFLLAFSGLVILVISFSVTLIRRKKVNTKGFMVGIGLSLAFLAVGGVTSFLDSYEKSTRAATALSVEDAEKTDSDETEAKVTKEEKDLFYSNLQDQLERYVHTMDDQIKIYRIYTLLEDQTAVKQKDVTNSSSNLEGLQRGLQNIQDMKASADSVIQEDHKEVLVTIKEIYNTLQKGEASFIDNDHAGLESLLNEEVKPLTEKYNNTITDLELNNDKLYSHAFDEGFVTSEMLTEYEKDTPTQSPAESEKTGSDPAEAESNNNGAKESIPKKQKLVASVDDTFEISGITLGITEREVHKILGTPNREGPQEDEMVSYDWMNHYGSLSVGYNSGKVTGLFYQSTLGSFHEGLYKELGEASIESNPGGDTRIFYHEATDQALKFEVHDDDLLIYLLYGSMTGYEGPYAESTYTTYNNDRYGFSFEYPANLNMDPPPTNGDGVHLYNDELDITAFGAHTNVMEDETIETYYQRSLDAVPVEDVYTKLKDDWYVVSYQQNGTIVYEQLFYGEESFNTFIIKYPANKQDKYGPIVSRISETFTPGNLE